MPHTTVKSESTLSVSNNIRPIFFVGMNGSGTTMLLDCFGRHPNLYGFPRETKFIPELISLSTSFGELTIDSNFYKLWKYIVSSSHFTKTNNGCPVPIPSNWQEFPRNLQSILDGVFRYFAAKQGKGRWCEKTPQYIQHMKSLQSIFKNAKFVHIIRDGRDSAASISRRYSRIPQHSIYRWKKVVSEGRIQGFDMGENYFEVFYEDLTSDPETWMRNICLFLEIPFDRSILTSRRPRTNQAGKAGENVSGLVPNSEKWREIYTKRQLIQFERIAGRTLDEFNYPVSNKNGDNDPCRGKLLLWRWLEYIKEFTKVLTHSYVNGHKIQWAELADRIDRALRQLKINRY